MREIKFRGKRVDNGSWVYGDLMTAYIHHEGLSIVEGGCIYHDVGPETVGQFTGLYDKNGKEIYEGDICRFWGFEVREGRQIRPERVIVVKWDYYELSKIKNILHPNSNFAGEIEVIGNIYDNPENPELLKEGGGSDG